MKTKTVINGFNSTETIDDNWPFTGYINLLWMIVGLKVIFYYIFFWSYIIYVNYSFPTDAKHGDYDTYTVKADGVIS